MKNIKKLFLSILAIAVLATAIPYTPHFNFEYNTVKAAVANKIPAPIALYEDSLALAINSSATTFTLVRGTDITGTSLATNTYGFIIDEGSATQEFVIADCTATACTNAIRGVSPVTGLTTVTALQKAHRRGASVKMTDAPLLLILKRLMNGEETLPNILSYLSHPTFTSDTQIVDKKYVDDVAIAGAPDAAVGTKGVTKLSVAPASPTNPIAVGTNDNRVSPVSLASLTAGMVDALAGTSGTPSSSNDYVTNDDTTATPTANKVVRYDANGLVSGAVNTAFYGDGSDGDVTIGSNTTLTSDMYYNNLTVSSGFTLTSASYRIFVKGTLTLNGTGKIVNNGNNGSNGSNGVSGSCGGGPGGAGGGGGGTGGIVAIYAKNIVVNGSAAIQALGGNGGNGGNGADGAASGSGSGGTAPSGGAGGSAVAAGSIEGAIAGVNGSAGGASGGCSTGGNAGAVSTAASTLANSIGSAASTSVGSTGGTGGNGGSGSGAVGGSGVAGGAVTSPIMKPRNVPFAINLYTTSPASATPIFVKSSNAANGGAGGGAGGSQGATGAGGGGGGAGGNGGSGGVIVLVYSSLTNSGSISAAGGTGGTGGTGGAVSGSGTASTSGSNGQAGATGVIYQLQII